MHRLADTLSISSMGDVYAESGMVEPWRARESNERRFVKIEVRPSIV